VPIQHSSLTWSSQSGHFTDRISPNQPVKFKDAFTFDTWGTTSQSLVNLTLDIEFVRKGKRSAYRNELNKFVKMVRASSQEPKHQS
jgi:hypothetical protein